MTRWRHKSLLARTRGWFFFKHNQFKFYKDFDIVFGMRYARMRHKEYLLRCQGCCQECGSTEDLTIDHIIPLKLNGVDNLWNKQLLCRKCNMAKSATPFSIHKSKARELMLYRKPHKPLPWNTLLVVKSIGKLILRKLTQERGQDVAPNPNSKRQKRIARIRQVREKKKNLRLL